MNTRTRLARLKRLERIEGLERAGQPDYSCPGFVIAPKVALEIVDDYQYLEQAVCEIGLDLREPDPAAEEQAAARLAENLRGIQCPPDYWRNQADADLRFLEGSGRPWDHYAQVKARRIVFEASPDGAAWRRMMDLSDRKRTRAEQAELDQLHLRYPGMPLKDYNPFYEFNRGFEASIREAVANGSMELTKPIANCYSTEIAVWNRVDRYR
jgi:hypothetical protein